MLTFFIIVTCLLVLAARSRTGEEKLQSGWFEAAAATSLAVGYASQGLLSLGMAANGLARHSAMPAVLAVGIIFITRQRSRKEIAQLLVAAKSKVSSLSAKKLGLANILVVVLVALALLISVGPINHPDSADYHVGYPYLYWLTGKISIDGGLHQGLTGLGDLAYIQFFNENTTWTMRAVQSLCIPILASTLARRGTNKLLIIALLSSPVLLQWLTIAKPLFLGETCIAISYIYWKEHKCKTSASMVIACVLVAISFKISVLLIAVPIGIDILIDWYKQRQTRVALDYPLLQISFACLVASFLYRYLVTGNPVYPLLSQVFTPGNAQFIGFEAFLRSYGRDGLFPASLIIPSSLGGIGVTIGPALGLALAWIIIQQINNRQFQTTQWTGTLQTLMLLFFGQGRPDYYACPIILLLCGRTLIGSCAPSFRSSLGNTLQIKINNIAYIGFIAILIGQVFLWLFLSLSSIYQSLAALNSYENSMLTNAWGYHTSKIINLNATPPFADLKHRNTRLYYRIPYVSGDRFNACVDNIDADKPAQALQTCMAKLNVNTLVVERGIIAKQDGFSCKSYVATIGSRNPFNKGQESFDLCKLDLEYQ